MKTVNIIGSGISGLATAFYLRKYSNEPITIKVFEKQSQTGGLIQGEETSLGPVNYAANGFLASKKVEELFSDLNIELCAASKLSKKKLFYFNGFVRWPLGVWESVTLIFLVLRFLLLKKLFAPKTNETLEAWGYRVLGKAFTDKVISVGVLGIYSLPARELSARLVLAKFFNWTKRAPRGAHRGTVSSPHGMNFVVNELKMYLQRQGVQFVLGHNCSLSLIDPREITIIATSLNDMLALTKEVNDPLYECFKDCQMLSVATVTVFEQASQAPQAFGCLFPLNSGFRARGVLFNHHIFPKSYKSSSQTWILNCKEESEVDANVSHVRSNLWPGATATECYKKFWSKALPKYDLQLEQALQVQMTMESPYYLVGNYLGRIGVADLLELASEVAEEIVEKADV